MDLKSNNSDFDQPWMDSIFENDLFSSLEGQKINPIPSPPLPLFKKLTYAKKVFVGGLPPDIDDVGIINAFSKFKPVLVDWPGKTRNKLYLFPPKGYAFLYFAREDFVHQLIQDCWSNGREFYFPVSSPSIKNKAAQVRPWKIQDAKIIIDPRLFQMGVSSSIERYPAFVGGIPRSMTSIELAKVANERYGNVGCVSIFLDGRTNYPRGSGFIVFTKFESYSKAISNRYTMVDNKFRCVEMKPFSFAHGWTDIYLNIFNSPAPVLFPRNHLEGKKCTCGLPAKCCYSRILVPLISKGEGYKWK